MLSWCHNIQQYHFIPIQITDPQHVQIPSRQALGGQVMKPSPPADLGDDGDDAGFHSHLDVEIAQGPGEPNRRETRRGPATPHTSRAPLPPNTGGNTRCVSAHTQRISVSFLVGIPCNINDCSNCSECEPDGCLFYYVVDHDPTHTFHNLIVDNHRGFLLISTLLALVHGYPWCILAVVAVVCDPFRYHLLGLQFAIVFFFANQLCGYDHRKGCCLFTRNEHSLRFLAIPPWPWIRAYISYIYIYICIHPLSTITSPIINHHEPPLTSIGHHFPYTVVYNEIHTHTICIYE